MEYWAKYPMNESGIRHFGGAIYGRLKSLENHGTFTMAFFLKNRADIYCKSIRQPRFRSYGRYTIEEGTLLEYRNWYKAENMRLPRKLKKRIISTRSRATPKSTNP